MNSKYRMIEVDAQNIDDMVSELLEYKSRGEMEIGRASCRERV